MGSILARLQCFASQARRRQAATLRRGSSRSAPNGSMRAVEHRSANGGCLKQPLFGTPEAGKHADVDPSVGTADIIFLRLLRLRGRVLRQSRKSSLEVLVMPIDPRRVKELFNAVVDLPEAADRAAFLERECGGDRELRERRMHSSPRTTGLPGRWSARSLQTWRELPSEPSRIRRPPVPICRQATGDRRPAISKKAQSRLRSTVASSPGVTSCARRSARAAWVRSISPSRRSR